MKIVKKIFPFGAALLMTINFADARIGESKSQLESRLLTKLAGGALEYETKEFREREALELPYRDMLLVMPRDISHNFYFKRANDTRTVAGDVMNQSTFDGWEIHICYYKDTSVMEFYRRRGTSLIPEEVARLMELALKENVQWQNFKAVPPPPDAPKTEELDSYQKIFSLLPKTKNRIVYLDVPENVASLPEYKQSIPYKIISEEQRKAYETYRLKNPLSPVDRKKQAAEQEKKKADEQKKSGVAASKFKNTSNADEAAISYGEATSEMIGKSIKFPYTIPTELDSAFGYNFKLSDESVHLKMYSDALLFIDSRFDKILRDYLEKLYQDQIKEKDDFSIKSVSKF